VVVWLIPAYGLIECDVVNKPLDQPKAGGEHRSAIHTLRHVVMTSRSLKIRNIPRTVASKLFGAKIIARSGTRRPRQRNAAR
jgi:hypothetical protein